ncbi:MAG: hypothetical protein V1709_06435 [Planctomycetota bacterium]
MKLTEEYIIKVINKVQKCWRREHGWTPNEGEIRRVIEIEHGIRKEAK